MDTLTIQEKQCLTLENYQVEILEYLGLLTDVHYFKVQMITSDDKDYLEQVGLLRVGSIESGLKRELDLRTTLNNYGLITPMIAHIQVDSVLINPTQQELEIEQPLEISNYEEISIDETFENQGDYLEEEFQPEKDIVTDSSLDKLIILTAFPEENKTLEHWLTAEHSLEESLSITIQICQLFFYIYQRQWCLIDLLPSFVEIESGKPVKFFDLTSAYPLGEQPKTGLMDNYYAPELAQAQAINESMSSYTIGALLYQFIHQKIPNFSHTIQLKINPIPRIYQLLKICLSPLSEERFSLGQLLNLLVETRKALRINKITWNIASQSTLGLSINRLQNEDNFGIRQQQISNSESLILGVVADGMGGMAQGEIASAIAVKTVLEEPISSDFKTTEKRAEWLLNLVEKANELITNEVRDGGTTLSVIMAVNENLMIAHVGDSRIYLLRKGAIQQLSEDHSLVAMLVASGEITQEESLIHPDRNVLLKSLGSKRRLSDGYVQNSIRNAEKNHLSLTLEDKDILLLCSDGVWDLVPVEELEELFTNSNPLQVAVNAIIDKVIARGASDNATLIALQCCFNKAY